VLMVLGAIGLVVLSRRISRRHQSQTAGFSRWIKLQWLFSLLSGILLSPVALWGLPPDVLTTLSGPLSLLIALLALIGISVVVLILKDEDFPTKELREILTLGIRLMGASSSALLVIVGMSMHGRL
jgi:FtsH-binding integral membrane protein